MYVVLLSKLGTEIVGLVPSRRWDFAIFWYIYSVLLPLTEDSEVVPKHDFQILKGMTFPLVPYKESPGVKPVVTMVNHQPPALREIRIIIQNKLDRFSYCNVSSTVI